MALDTKHRVFVAYALPWPAAMHARHGGDGTRQDHRSSSAPSGLPGSSGAVHDGESEAARAGSAMTKRMSADVLVVDDDSDVRWTVAEILRSAGFSVAEAEDGEIALGLLSAHRYRLVLLDVRMPKRDGVAVMEALEEAPPVVVHSAYTIDAEQRERLGTRVVDYLHKPVSPQKLLRAVETVLGNPE
jgi:two-component system, chemotaxis family, chemotaxis protein CheY